MKIILLSILFISTFAKSQDLIFKSGFEIFPTAESFTDPSGWNDRELIDIPEHTSNAIEFELMSIPEHGDIYCYINLSTRMVMSINEICALDSVEYEVTDGSGYVGDDLFDYRVNNLSSSSTVETVTVTEIADS